VELRDEIAALSALRGDIEEARRQVFRGPGTPGGALPIFCLIRMPRFSTLTILMRGSNLKSANHVFSLRPVAMKAMTRRHFISSLAAAAIATGCGKVISPRQTTGRVIVIGAGISGLAAAESLGRSGVRATVLEARNRIGGRIWTDRSLGAPVDMGASWIHGERKNPITALCRRNSIRTLASDLDDRALIDRDGAQIPLAEVEKWEEIIAEAEEIAARSGDDVAIATAIETAVGGRELTPREERIFENILAGIECEFGGSSDRLSGWYLNADEGFDGDDLAFPGGYAAVPEALAVGLDIKFEEPVKSVSCDANGAIVETGKGRYEADAVIVTLPLGILKRGQVAFAPDLPDQKLAAIERLGFGVLNKVAVKFSRAFWPEETEFFEYLAGRRAYGPVTSAACATCHEPPTLRESSGFSEFVNMVPVNGAPVLLALTGGPFGHRLDSWPDEKVASEVTRTIRAMFGGSIPEPDGIVVSRWHADPWAGGAYSHLPVGASPDDYKILARACHGGVLHFAGEATNASYPGTVHGAFLSGQRAAKEVLARLG
jgi:monoamine oxidase